MAANSGGNRPRAAPLQPLRVALSLAKHPGLIDSLRAAMQCKSLRYSILLPHQNGASAVTSGQLAAAMLAALEQQLQSEPGFVAGSISMQVNMQVNMRAARLLTDPAAPVRVVVDVQAPAQHVQALAAAGAIGWLSLALPGRTAWATPAMFHVAAEQVTSLVSVSSPTLLSNEVILQMLQAAGGPHTVIQWVARVSPAAGAGEQPTLSQVAPATAAATVAQLRTGPWLTHTGYDSVTHVAMVARAQCLHPRGAGPIAFLLPEESGGGEVRLKVRPIQPAAPPPADLVPQMQAWHRHGAPWGRPAAQPAAAQPSGAPAAPLAAPRAGPLAGGVQLPAGGPHAAPALAQGPAQEAAPGQEAALAPPQGPHPALAVGARPSAEQQQQQRGPGRQPNGLITGSAAAHKSLAKATAAVAAAAANEQAMLSALARAGPQARPKAAVAEKPWVSAADKRAAEQAKAEAAAAAHAAAAKAAQQAAEQEQAKATESPQLNAPAPALPALPGSAAVSAALDALAEARAKARLHAAPADDSVQLALPPGDTGKRRRSGEQQGEEPLDGADESRWDASGSEAEYGAESGAVSDSELDGAHPMELEGEGLADGAEGPASPQ